MRYFREYIDSRRAEAPSGSSTDQDGHSGPVISYSGRFPTLREAEDYLIAEALERADGNQSVAARMLGVSQSTLSRRLSK